MTLGIGILGHGFMGRTHETAWTEAAELGVDCEVRAIAARAADAAAVIADPLVDIISICTPTDSHIELAVAALGAGKHVLLEKPVALSVRAMQPLLAAAGFVADAGTSAAPLRGPTTPLCMPAHCMRFWPGWPYARDAVADGRYGALLGAEFRRVGAAPSWNTQFYSDPARSGGALFDLHIHDADFALWCFGEPLFLACSGRANHVHATYGYDGFDVRVEGAWMDDPAVAFEMKYRMTFERGVLDFSFDRKPRLCFEDGEGRREVALPTTSAYTLQAVHFGRAVMTGRPDLAVTLHDAAAVIDLIEREARLISGDFQPATLPSTA